MPKFQPRIVPKNITLHNTSKKQHISFDNDDSDKEEPTTKQVQVKKRKGNDNNNKNNSGITNNNSNTNKNVKVKKGNSITISHLKEIIPTFQPKTALKQLTKEEAEALKEKRGLARREANRKKKKEKKKAKQLAKVVDGVTVKRALLHLTPDVLKGRRKYISIVDIRQFALYCLIDDQPPLFCHITNRSLVERVIVVYATGLDIVYFGAPLNREKIPYTIDLATVTSKDAIGKGNMPFLTSSVFRHMFVTKIGGTKGFHLNPTSQLLQSQVTQSRKLQLHSERKQLLEKENIDKNTMFTLDLEDLRGYKYPIPPFLDESVTLPEGWKETRPSLEPTDKKKLIAIDCEMVLTESGRALARVSLVDEDGNILLDEYVRPDEPIIDYLTEYSGITPSIMAETDCSLRRAQKHVRKLVDHNVILVGHSIDSDLNALKLAHPYCADTSLLYDSPRGPPYKPSLRALTSIHLKRKIQVTSKEKLGHNSAEDALATMDLFKLKVKNGFKFGRNKNDLELIFDRFHRNRQPRKGMILECNTGKQTFQAGRGIQYGNLSTDELLTSEVIKQITNEGGDEANDHVNFILAKYDGLKFKDMMDDGDEDLPPVVTSSNTVVDREKAVKLAVFDQYLKRIYDEAPKNTAIVVLGGLGHVPKYIRLMKKYNKYKEFMNMRKTGEEEDLEEITWTSEDQNEFELESQKAKMTCSFVTVK
ncbi:unnamed protein product [Cunninghamella blakesleeana]